jgi:predicted transcriptional regulator
MNKAVMLSIRPKWVEKIASGEKTIEVRKTKPKLDTPFKCYIYCTLPKYPHEDFIATDYPMPQFYGGGKVIGEFICDRCCGIVCVGFDVVNAAKLTREDLEAYLAGGEGYGWHISDLRIYDPPRELSEFQRATDPCDSCHAEYTWECTDCKKWGGNIKRPPQSWCYVEAMKDE